jgi:hypothetical protein
VSKCRSSRIILIISEVARGTVAAAPSLWWMSGCSNWCFGCDRPCSLAFAPHHCCKSPPRLSQASKRMRKIVCSNPENLWFSQSPSLVVHMLIRCHQSVTYLGKGNEAIVGRLGDSFFLLFSLSLRPLKGLNPKPQTLLTPVGLGVICVLCKGKEEMAGGKMEGRSGIPQMHKCRDRRCGP